VRTTNPSGEKAVRIGEIPFLLQKHTVRGSDLFPREKDRERALASPQMRQESADYIKFM
jgi:hypothetical protein